MKKLQSFFFFGIIIGAKKKVFLTTFSCRPSSTRFIVAFLPITTADQSASPSAIECELVVKINNLDFDNKKVLNYHFYVLACVKKLFQVFCF